MHRRLVIKTRCKLPLVSADILPPEAAAKSHCTTPVSPFSLAWLYRAKSSSQRTLITIVPPPSSPSEQETTRQATAHCRGPWEVFKWWRRHRQRRRRVEYLRDGIRTPTQQQPGALA
ncbi:hypothetical protein BDFG_07009 [Blastomyces dermatitidis ATCC 26199]|nr:hypothetical protein BDFG_07009 [Blastomyces dermatitidis ATCC 26199]